MRVLFCHDGPIIVNNSNYFAISHNDKSLSRYLFIGDKLSILIRTRIFSNEINLDSLSQIKLKPLEIISVPNFSSPISFLKNINKATPIIKNAVESSDYIVIRLPSFIGIKALFTSIRCKKPYIVELVANPFDILWNHSFLGKLVAPLMHVLTKKAVKTAVIVENHAGHVPAPS